MSPSIIMRADDFGVTPGTNDAILDGIACGTIRCVGLLAPGPCLDYRLDELLATAGKIDLGVHAAINSEWPTLRWGPISPAPQVPGLLADDGAFHPNTQESNRQSSTPEILLEVEAQLNHLRVRGVQPDYLDCHMGFNWLPGVDDGLRALCAREDLLFGNDEARFPRLDFGDATDWRLLRPNDAELPLPGLLGPAALIIWHPAYQDAASAAFGQEWAARRDNEARLLTSEDFVRQARAAGIEFVSYREAATAQGR